MFAVTQEDFVHPMAVIELLWRSCCASEAEKQASSLATRLKVRQWTQMLVDHSLLLGSSSEGVHLHDIVLQYLRKRLTAAASASRKPSHGNDRVLPRQRTPVEWRDGDASSSTAGR